MSSVSRLLAALLMFSLAGVARAQANPTPSKAPGAQSPERAERVRSRYTKYEFHIPMRDGVKLFTSVYVPVDASATRRYPILMERTPYSVAPYGLDRYKASLGHTEAFEKEGFIFVFQDVRGAHMSEGEFVNVRPHKPKKSGPKDTDESTDTYDTIEWLVNRVPFNNGRVGQWGGSYPGFYTSAGAIDSHPALKAVSPQAPIADWFIGDDMHRNGAFNLTLAFNFFSTFGQPRPKPTDSEEWDFFEHGTPDGYQFFMDLGPLPNAESKHLKGEVAFWKDIVAHPNYDAFWQARNLLPNLKNIKAAVLVVGGWFDTEDLYGPLRTYAAIEKQNPGISNSIIMGPWSHGGWIRTEGSSLGDADFGFRTSDTYADLSLAFFKHHLKEGEKPALPEAMVFETGANRWRQLDAWPPKNARPTKLFFQPKGGLSTQAPTGSAESFAEYLSDPNKPVPYTKEISTHWSSTYMTEDQRFAATRPDVVVFQTEPLEEDLTVAGPLEAELWVSTTGSDADWVVKLVDVTPGTPQGVKKGGIPEKGKPNRGHQQTLVRGEPFRGRFRDGFSTPKPFKPGEVTKVRYTINDVFHTFQRGHRVMIQVQSSWFPFIDRNPQTFVPNIFEAKESDFTRAFHRVYTSAAHPSFIQVGVLPALDAQGG
ncbi:CocE/NonD family hydrolase [Myxococcus sp. K15C18031901]|uniref:CocE/NonD family hydrolase n=1 Tax=Myxococcus dinghuensis TaxID=2906761 RepID=UPI0020A817B0|nr:CocE/NonD family hydrolase [Myxococcus dinghuensis]MCP3103900.1 CocE/NonD family hydrolase [Myxococcus dinghuensis]